MNESLEKVNTVLTYYSPLARRLPGRRGQVLPFAGTGRCAGRQAQTTDQADLAPTAGSAEPLSVIAVQHKRSFAARRTRRRVTQNRGERKTQVLIFNTPDELQRPQIDAAAA